jgi:ADP-L-glycero-D-manno-heptose 6-epimerase
MNLLITGSKGFIGQNLVNYFVNEGHTVAEYDYIENVIPDCSPFDNVIHMGAISSTTERNVESVLAHNLDFSHRLLQVCEMQGVNLIYASSASVYGDTGVFKEYGPVYPQSAYAWSKYLFDRTINQIDKSDFRCNIKGLRFFNVYGEHEEHKGDQMSVFHKFKQQALETGKIHPFEDSDKYLRDFIYVGDVCRIVDKMLDIDDCGIWNVGTGTPRSFQSIAEAVAEKYKAEIVPIPMPDALKQQYQKYTCSDNTRLLKTIGKFNFTSPEEWINGQ